jgi:hypothetical protein
MRLLIAAIALSAASSALGEDLVVLGRLKDIEKEVAACGVFYVGSVAQYEVLQVLSGTYTGKTIFVVHGCTEMPRSTLSKDAGTLTSFVIGDVHTLVLVPENIQRIEIFNATKIPPPFSPYFCKRVDPLESRKQQSHNNRLLSDAYASALNRVSFSAPKSRR